MRGDGDEKVCIVLAPVAARARLSKQTMTTLVRLMEGEGLVLREPDPEDGRAVRVRLTERALAFRPVAEAVLTELEELVSARLSPRDVSRLDRYLQEVMSL